MIRPSNIITTISSILFLAVTVAYAHEGFDHVMGTVVKTVGNVVTVNTGKSNVDVKLNEKTELTKNNQKAQIADLKPGGRVVVDIPEGSKDKVAHSIKIGTAASADQHAKEIHK